MPKIAYPSVATQEITDAEFGIVHRLMTGQPTMKVTAIKFVKEQYGLGLSEAKALCERIAEMPLKQSQY